MARPLPTPLVPGEQIACYTDLGLAVDAPTREQRIYAVRATCCGRVLERREETLRDYGRRPKANCLQCAQALANQKKRASCGFHERFGPAVVIGRGERAGHWRVRWDCCGREAELSRKYLVNLRRFARLGDHTAAVCQLCALERARGAMAQVRAAKPVVPVARPVPVPVVPKPKPKPETLRITPAGAELPHGTVSAASAWPRPGRAGV